ncbi:hypothetical protein ABES03_08390 [Neobacillus rhizosphaerae]|uniref:hypothetical protein n=1 Tax=Neobacillus rhizosphaerae TaxID=2880965 RepID=UPI003D27829A
MINVQIGNTVKAIGMGALFVSMVPNSAGQGVVVHVANPEGIATDPEVLSQNYNREYLTDGILFKDSGNGEILWLASDDFEILA